MAITYKKITTVSVTSAVATIDFTNIPATYTDLHIIMSAKGDQTTYNYESLYVRFNSDTTNANYTHWYAYAEATGVYQNNYSDGRAAWMNSNKMGSSYFANVYIYIPQYTGNKNKTFFGESAIEGNQATTMLGFYTTKWANTSAISSITLDPSAGNFSQYTTATLYGISNTV